MSEKDTKPAFYQVELRELQSLLRKKLGDDLEVLDYKTASLLPAGENYGSTMLKVHAITQRRGQNEGTKTMDLVAKMLPPTDFQRRMFDSPYTFKKEAFLYEELIPSYKRLEQDVGLGNEEKFDIVPEFFGARYSLKDDDSFDDDAVLLLQNLQVLGYYTGDRREGLDFEHGKVALIALARFHALGIAMKERKPKYFDLLKDRAISLQMPNDNGFDGAMTKLLRAMKQDPEVAIHSDFLDKAFDLANDPKHWFTPAPEPWTTIIHSDFWVNNMMFHKNSKTNRVDDVKFVDFQNYLLMSPLRELIFFLMVSLKNDVIENRFDELLNIYYEKFIDVLTRMKVDTRHFARDKFDKRLKIDAYNEFAHCPIMLNILTMEVKADEKFDNPDKFIKEDSVSDSFRPKFRAIVKKYVEKGWSEKLN